MRNTAPRVLERQSHIVTSSLEQDHPRHIFLQLAHVNRQFGYEFLSVYYQSRISRVRFAGAAAFAEDFLLSKTVAQT